MILVYAPLIVAVIGIGLAVFGCRRKPHRPGLQGAGVALLLVGLTLSLLGLNIQPYVRNNSAAVRPMAAIAVKTLYPVAGTFSVTVQRLDGTHRSTTCILKGSDWALEGHMQRWRWWAFVLGMRQSYVADRIVGIHNTPMGARRVSACSLLPPRPKLTPYLPGGLIRGLIHAAIAAERAIGQTPPRPLSDGALYRVDISPNGFIATPQMLSSQIAAADVMAH